MRVYCYSLDYDFWYTIMMLFENRELAALAVMRLDQGSVRILSFQSQCPCRNASPGRQGPKRAIHSLRSPRIGKGVDFDIPDYAFHSFRADRSGNLEYDRQIGFPVYTFPIERESCEHLINRSVGINMLFYPP